MFRAQEVKLFNIMFPREQAYQIIAKMGWLENAHLIDMQPDIPSVQRPYYAQLRRCEILSGHLDEIEVALKQLNFPISHCPNIEGYLDRLQIKLNDPSQSPKALFDKYEQDILHKLGFLEQQQNNLFKIIEKRNSLYEQKALMQQGKDIILKDYQFSSRMMNNYQGSLRLRSASESEQNTNLQAYTKNKQREIDFKLNCLAGSISSADIDQFHRLLFRASKGNLWFNVSPIKKEDVIIQENLSSIVPNGLIDAKTYQVLSKSTFILFFQSGLHDVVRKKLVKLCEAFNVVFYDLPDDGQQFESVYGRLQTQLQEVESLLELTSKELRQYALFFTGIHAKQQGYDVIYAQGNASYIEEIRLFIQLEKAIYYHLNFFISQGSMVNGRFWCPQSYIEEFSNKLREVSDLFQIFPNINENLYEPPTFLRVNDVCWGFQELVNTYGTPRYGEINPGIFTIITFPFLFGIMFGDIGHGTLLTIFGLYMLQYGQDIVMNTNQKYRADPIECRDIKYLYKARYMILLMGLFSTYCGFIYNDFFSVSLNYTQSCWDKGLKVANCSPAFGLDGIWSISGNELTMTNSMKMKLAIIVGVTHMVFGILMKGLNTIHNRSYIDFTCEFIPQLFFMLSTFGYMSFLIIIKWFTIFEDTSEAPSIITTLLNMAFKVGGVVGYQFYNMQPTIQFYLLCVTLICVPWMLILKPVFKVMSRNKHSARQGDHVEFQDEPNQIEMQQMNKVDNVQQSNNAHGQLVESREIKEEKHFQVDEIVIEQVIETIEFVLGSVSNTASYLRLWALSLAHNQLSQVFFQKTLGSALLSGSIPAILGTFLLFFGITVMVLMCMDALECFLHALRLHWVEFQNKFYKADGYSFQYFSFKQILEDDKDFNTRV